MRFYGKHLAQRKGSVNISPPPSPAFLPTEEKDGHVSINHTYLYPMSQKFRVSMWKDCMSRMRIWQSMDTLQVGSAVWMMTTYLAGRFILVQCVSLASQTDRGMMSGQAVQGRKTKDMEPHLGPCVENLTTAGWVTPHVPSLWHQSTS